MVAVAKQPLHVKTQHNSGINFFSDANSTFAFSPFSSLCNACDSIRRWRRLRPIIRSRSLRLLSRPRFPLITIASTQHVRYTHERASERAREGRTTSMDGAYQNKRQTYNSARTQCKRMSSVSLGCCPSPDCIMNQAKVTLHSACYPS